MSMICEQLLLLLVVLAWGIFNLVGIVSTVMLIVVIVIGLLRFIYANGGKQ